MRKFLEKKVLFFLEVKQRIQQLLHHGPSFKEARCIAFIILEALQKWHMNMPRCLNAVLTVPILNLSPY
tara:strand:- start:15694 stop:15900 length:207 start_codon:yes stop_codon:yes gene_type:complete